MGNSHLKYTCVNREEPEHCVSIPSDELELTIICALSVDVMTHTFVLTIVGVVSTTYPPNRLCDHVREPAKLVHRCIGLFLAIHI